MSLNQDILTVIEDAFSEYIRTGERSNKKLRILHGAISRNLKEKLGPEYEIKSLGVGDDREDKIVGRYMDKKVDISISKKGKLLGGIAVKYVMSNYCQNSNNYFENMLGETANIRCNNLAYFQILIIHKHMPYFEKGGVISKTEELKEYHIRKYIKLSDDDPESMLHTPTKTLLMVVDHVSKGNIYLDKPGYKEHYSDRSNIHLELCTEGYKFKDTVVYNDYETYLNKVVHYLNYLGN